MPSGHPHAHEPDGGGGGGAANHSNHQAHSPPALPAKLVPAYPPPESEDEETWVWTQIKAEACRDADAEPALASFLYATVLSHSSLPRSFSFHLSNKL
jgi:serine O-acetyltransferase